MLCKTCITFLCGKLTHHQKTSWLKLRSSCKMQVRGFQDGVRKKLIIILITGVWMKQAGALMSQTQSRTEFYFLALIDNLKMLLDTLTNHLAWVAATNNYLLQPPAPHCTMGQFMGSEGSNFLQKWPNSGSFWARKMFFFFK